MEGRSQRHRTTVNYSDKQGNAGSGTPLWLKKTIAAERSLSEPEAGAKENSKPAKASGKRKQAEAAIAQRGRNAGVSVVPIADHKKQKQQVQKGRQSRGSANEPVGAEEERKVPGLPGVVQKPVAKPAAKPAVQKAGEVATSAEQAGKAGPSAGGKPGSGGKQGSGSGSERKQTGAQDAAEAEVPARAEQPVQQKQQRQHEEEQQPLPKRQKPLATRAEVAAAAQQKTPGSMAGAPAAAPPLAFPSPPPGNAEQLVEHFSRSFLELQGEYERLQQQYEDLKSAKIDHEVQQLLEQHNKYVTDHGARAAELAEHWRLEAERQEAVARELGGEEALQRAQQLEAELLQAQEGLLDLEAAALEKDKRILELEKRNAFLERHARIPTLSDKCIQTDGPAVAGAAVQAPSLEPSGLEMLEARALAPEGAGGGSIYKRPQRKDAGAGSDVAGLDASYTLPPPTVQPAHRAAAAADAAGPAPEEDGAPPVPPQILSGSNMQLTGSVPQVVRGRLAQAAAVPVSRLARGLTAESEVAAALRQPEIAAAAVEAPGAAAAGPAPSAAAALVLKRASLAARPAALQRVEKQLHFPSASCSGGLQPQASASIRTAAARGVEQPIMLPAAIQQPQQQQPAVPSQPAASMQPASSGPFAPRELALTALTGLVATPLKGGCYKFMDPHSGFAFEFGPAAASPDDTSDEEEGPALSYKPLALGAAQAVLPSFLHYPITFAQAEQHRFMEALMDALRRVPRQH